MRRLNRLLRAFRGTAMSLFFQCESFFLVMVKNYDPFRTYGTANSFSKRAAHIPRSYECKAVVHDISFLKSPPKLCFDGLFRFLFSAEKLREVITLRLSFRRLAQINVVIAHVRLVIIGVYLLLRASTLCRLIRHLSGRL